jgi:hypothetical protein
MCDKCNAIDVRIEHYRVLESRMTDQALLDGIKVLVAELEARKVAVHPEGSLSRTPG